MDPVATPDELPQLLNVPEEEVRTEETDDDSHLDAVRGPDGLVDDSLRTTEDPLTIALGSLLEVKVYFLCADSSIETGYLRDLGSGSTEGAQLSVRGRLHLAGGSSQKGVASASVCLEPSHCASELCSRLFTDKGEPVTLRFELSPDVVTNAQPQLCLEVRSRRSRKVQMSLWITLQFLLRKMSAGVEYRCSFPLLDPEEKSCGRLSVSFRSGLQAALRSNEVVLSTTEHKPEACILSVSVVDLQALGNVSDKIPCFARIWSSSTGKSSAQTITSLSWGKEGLTTENREPKAVSLKVNDRNTEVLFIGIYRFSSHERNDLLGRGTFTVPVSVAAQQTVRLSDSESAGRDTESGSVVLALQTTNAEDRHEAKSEISLAATGLGSVAYPVQSGELKGRFDIEILQAQSLPPTVADGDTVTIQLRVAQSSWKTELGPVNVVAGNDGSKKLATMGEKTHLSVCWSPKDRSFPLLEVLIYLQRQRQSNRIGLASSASLTQSSRLKRRQAAKTSPSKGDSDAPVLLATGSLNLTSFFSQLNVSVLTDLQLAVESALMATDPVTGDKTPAFLPMVANLRASTCQEDGSKSPIQLGTSTPAPQFVKGDVCVHLLQATGSVFRKASSLSSYYVVISSGTEEVVSSCCSVDDSHTLSWNQQLALHIASSCPPVIRLTLYQRALGSEKQTSSTASQLTRDSEIVGYLTLPIFPSVLEENHLLQLELPFGMPPITESTTQGNDPCYYKRGMITLELQFLSSLQPKTSTAVPTEALELSIHRVRGNLQGTNTATVSCGLAKHVFIEICLLTDRGGKTQEVGVGTTSAIALSTSGVTEVGELISLSNSLVATTLSNDPSSVLVGRIRDFSGNVYGRVHVPLRKDWRSRLVRPKKQVWYPICVNAGKDTAVKKDAVLMSLQAVEQEQTLPIPNADGKFHVSICEVVLNHSSSRDSLKLLKLGKYGGACVEMSCIGSSNEKRFRTSQTMDPDNSHHWRWENEWFGFVGETHSQELRFSLHVGAKSNQPRLQGLLDLGSTIEDAKLRRLNLWIPLTGQVGSDEAVSAHLHVVVVYFPMINGTICLEFAESYTFSESEQVLHVESTFYNCTINGASYTSVLSADESSGSAQRLRLPFDSRNDNSAEIPELTIQRMGVAKLLGEFCLGVLSLDILSMLDMCSLASSTSTDTTRERFTWCEFNDKSDRAKTTGVAKLRVAFEPARNATKGRTGSSAKNLENRVASAEVFTLWKKLFYLLDQNGNGYIDRKEFTNVFVNHLEGMVETSDGQKLLRLLFHDNNQDNTHTSKDPPTEQQIAALFSKMDTNRDNEIEWTEYLRFLEQRQHQVIVSEQQDEADPAIDDNSQVEHPQIEQKRELRKKHREDKHATPLSKGQAVTVSNQDEIPPERTTEANARSEAVKQEPSAPKRSGKVSSAEAKLLKLQYSNHEQSRLQQQITSLETILAVERRRYAELAADRQALMRSYQQLHLKHQNEMIQEQTKAKWMKQTIERQQQQLQERETLRQSRNQASIVLQSTVRSRLEQKRFQGFKLQRSNAAIAIQCMVRRVKAKKAVSVLQELDQVLRQRIRAATRLQRFVRYHLYRKERALLLEARRLSATILQKNARRVIASSAWHHQKMAVVKLQCWIRQHLAVRRVTRIRRATMVVKTAVVGWFARWQYAKIKRSSRRLQRWWKRASKERSAFLELMEAALCIQSAWKRRATRKWYEREWERQEAYLSELEASICIQAAWRGRNQRLRSIASRMDDDSVIEALLYSIVASIEADADVLPSSANAIMVAHSTDTLAGEDVDTFTNGADDLLSLSSVVSEDKDDTTGEEDDVVPVLKSLVDAVVASNENELRSSTNSQDGMTLSDGIVGYENVISCTSVNETGNSGDDADGASADSTAGDVTSPIAQAAEPMRATHHAISDANIDDVGSNMSGVVAVLADSPVDESVHSPPQESETAPLVDVLDSDDFAIIQSLLEHIKDLIESRALIDDTAEGSKAMSSHLKAPSNQVEAIEQRFPPEHLDEVQPAVVASEEGTDALADGGFIMSDEQAMAIAAFDKEPVNVDSSFILPIGGAETEEDNDSGQERVALASDTGADTPVVAKDQLSNPIVLLETEEEASKSPEVPPGGIVDEESVKSNRSDILSNEPGLDVVAKLQQEIEATPEKILTTDEENFDVETAIGDFAMPIDGDSGRTPRLSDSDEDAGGSSMDSDDLMLEADAMAGLQDAAVKDQATVAEQTSRQRKTERMDSSVLLADFDQLEAQGNLPSADADTNEEVDYR